MKIRKNITIEKEQEDFLEKNPKINISAILRNAIDDMMKHQDPDDANTKELHRKMKVLARVVDNQRKFIEDKGLIDEFINSIYNPFKSR